MTAHGMMSLDMDQLAKLAAQLLDSLPCDPASGTRNLASDIESLARYSLRNWSPRPLPGPVVDSPSITP